MINISIIVERAALKQDRYCLFIPEQNGLQSQVYRRQSGIKSLLIYFHSRAQGCGIVDCTGIDPLILSPGSQDPHECVIMGETACYIGYFSCVTLSNDLPVCCKALINQALFVLPSFWILFQPVL